MSFHPNFAATIAMLCALAILVALGAWQLQRKEWKEALIAAVDARIHQAPSALTAVLEARGKGDDVRYTPVRLTGRYRHNEEAHVFGALNGAAGYYIFTPFITDMGTIYVNRGFAPQALKNRETRAAGLPEGAIEITGLLREGERKEGLAGLLSPSDAPEDNIWYIRDPKRFGLISDTPVPDWYIDSSGAENAGDWPKGGVTRVVFPNRHLEYALTWFGLGGALLGVWFAFSRRGP